MSSRFRQALHTWRIDGQLTPERALLLAAVSVPSDHVNEQGRAAIAHPNFRWDVLLEFAEAQNVRPLLARFLDGLESAAIPAEVRATLSQALRHNAFRNLQMAGELITLKNLFAANGLNAIPFKGPTLAVLAYGDLSWREFGDLDILLPRKDLFAAGELMLARTYEPFFPLASLHNSAFLNICNELSFQHPHKELLVELHWELSPRLFRFALDWQEIQTDLTPVSLAGKPLHTFSLPLLLLYLCAHGARHSWASLGWIADVAWLIARHPQLDWAETLRLANKTQHERVLGLGLWLASELLGATLPPEIEQRLRADQTAEQLALQIARWLIVADATEPGTLERNWFFLQLRESLRSKASYLVNQFIAPNGADWEFMQLPAHLSFLYPAVHSVRLLKEYLPSFKS